MSEVVHLVGLEAENVKRVRLVELAFSGKGELIVVGGSNEAGKSSLLDSIEWAIEGAAGIDREPLRKGATRGRAKVTLRADDGTVLHVERVFTTSGTRLVVTDAEGKQQKSPQALLSSFISALSFDPLHFTKMPAAERAAALMRIGGLGETLAQLKAEEEAAREKRTEAGRVERQVKAQLDGIPTIPSNTPDTPISVEILTDELEGALEAASERAAVQRGFESARNAVEQARRADHEARERLAAARRMVEQLEEEQASKARTLEYALDNESEQLAKVEAEAARPLPNPDEIRMKIREVESINENVRRKQESAQLSERLQESASEVARLRRAMGEIEERRRKAIAAAPLPVAGLGFDANGHVTIDGHPFEQASTAQQLKVSLAIGMALNPNLRLLIVREGSMLDEKNLALVAAAAEEHGFCVLLERVGRGEEVSVVIEDGMVGEDRRADVPAPASEPGVGAATTEPKGAPAGTGTPQQIEFPGGARRED